jgi:hypothetical protein
MQLEDLRRRGAKVPLIEVHSSLSLTLFMLFMSREMSHSKRIGRARGNSMIWVIILKA